MKDHLIVFFPLVNWDDPWQRYQHLATELSKHNRVIYFEPPLSVKYLLEKPTMLLKKLPRMLRKKEVVRENLFVLCSAPILPFGNKSHLVNYINQFIIFLLLKIFAIRLADRKKLCLWISNAIHYPLINWVKPGISVYDCTDAFSFTDSKKQAYHDILRHNLIRDSSVSFFTSKLYLKDGKKYSGNYHYVPNGVDITNFAREYYPVPEELKNLRRPILGFVGTVDSRIDRHLIKEILNKMPDISLVFVGPIAEEVCEFKEIDGVFFLGKKSFTEIPNYMNQFDVALIPYIPKKAQVVYPVKLHEYLILGKPVVSTNINEIMQFSEVVYVASNTGEYIEKIGLALREKNEDKKKRRVQTALRNTWSARLKKINEELGKIADESGASECK